jgi:heat shock protein HslJ
VPLPPLLRRLAPALAPVQALALAAALAACTSSAPAPTGPAPGDLTGTNWELTRWQESERTLRPIPHAETGDPLTLAFEQKAGKPALSGFSGCNTYSGGYALNGNVLEAGSLAVTKKACETPQRSQIETDYLAAFDDGVAVTRDAAANPPELRLKMANGQTLVFRQR